MVYFLLVLFDKIKSVGPFPIWVSIPGALLMCYLPVKLLSNQERLIAVLLAIMTLVVGLGHFLIAMDSFGYGTPWIQRFLDFRF